VRDGHRGLVWARPGCGRLQLELVAGAGTREVTNPPGAAELTSDRAVDRAQRPARGGRMEAAARLVCQALQARPIRFGAEGNRVGDGAGPVQRPERLLFGDT